VVGRLAERGFDRRYLASVAAMSLGLLIVYASGVAWLGIVAHVPQALGVRSALVAGAVPFFVADAMKILLAAAILPGMWKLMR
jgi:biotin transport system substrate-specific component